MPQLDAYIPAGALTPDAEPDLMAKLTDLLIRHEGADPTNETVRSIAWVFVHRARHGLRRAASPPRFPATASSPRSPRASSTRSAARR